MEILSSMKMDRSRTLCQSCLSDDRKLNVIEGSVLESYLYLLGLNLKTPSDCVALCWECAALLRAVQRFQKRTWQAHEVLRSLHPLNSTTVQCLSTLSTSIFPEEVVIKSEEDVLIGYTSSTKRTEDVKNYFEVVTPDFLPKHEGLDKFKNETDSDEDTFSDNGQRTDIPFASTTDGKNDNLVAKKNKPGAIYSLEGYDPYEINRLNGTLEGNKYSKYKNADVKVNPTLDLNNLESHYSKVYVSEAEMSVWSQTDLKRDGRGRQFICKTCKAKFKHILYLRRHNTFNHISLTTPPYECLQCKASVRSLPELESHWREHCVVYSCSLCGETTPVLSFIRRHILRNHSRIYICLDCDASFKYNTDYLEHRNEFHKHLMCDYCGRQFRSKKTIENHISHHHLPNKCKYCSRVYRSYKHLRDHNKDGCTWHRRRQVPGADGDENAYCVECDKQFPTVRKYAVHLKYAPRHRTAEVKQIPGRYLNRNVPCPACSRQFYKQAAMERHFAKQHRKSRLNCDQCDKDFSCEKNLVRHRKFVHERAPRPPAPRDKVCDICGRGFTVSVRSVQCVVCHRKFVHERAPRPPAPRDKVCDICGRGFTANAILANHRRTHTGERPFACAHCSAAFAQLVALRGHMRSQHKIPWSSTSRYSEIVAMKKEFE